MAEHDSLLASMDAMALPETISREWLLEQFLAPMGVEPSGPVAEGCEDIFLTVSANVDGALQMRPGGWRVNVAGTVTKALLATALVSAALAVAGADDIPIELIPAVLPVIADIERVRLDRRDRALYVPVVLASAGLEGQAVNPQIVYDRLDAVIREEVNYGDFLAFCDRLIEAGMMDDGGYDDIKPRRAGDVAWIRVTLQ